MHVSNSCPPLSIVCAHALMGARIYAQRRLHACIDVCICGGMCICVSVLPAGLYVALRAHASRFAVQACSHAGRYACIWACMCVCVFMCLYICISADLLVYIYIRIYIYIYIFCACAGACV